LPSPNRSKTHVAYAIFTGLGLMYAFYLGYLRPLPERLALFDPWQVGDWLIDYSGGLVRRGFSGALVFAVTPEGFNPTALVVGLQTFSAAFLFVVVGIMYMRTDRGPAWIMLVLSPAFLLFPALDVAGNTRKELLVLATLAGVATAMRTRFAHLALWLGLPFFGIAVLSHEALIVTLPAFAYVAFMAVPRRQAWRLFFAYALISLTAFLIALLWPATEQITSAVCATWTERGLEDCGGSLAALSVSVPETMQSLGSDLFPYYWDYLLPVALATLPFFALRFLPREKRIALIIVAAALPLFFITVDYGRWIFLIVSQLSILALALPERSRAMRVYFVGALAYIALWSFSHVGRPFDKGLVVRWLFDFSS
jgi:hypothetical protein